MAIAFVNSYTSQSKTSNTTIVAPNMTVAVGETLFAFATFDNLTATTPTVISITGAGTWTKVASFDSPQAAAASGVRGELWRLDVISGIEGLRAYTVNLSAAVTARALVILQFTGVGALDSIASTTVSNSGLSDVGAPGSLMLGFAGTENSAGPTFGGVNMSGMTIIPANGTTGGSAVTNVFYGGRYWIVPGSTSVTLSSIFTDGGLIFGTFFPAPDPVISQAAYRFYADGTETGSTALAAQDAAPSVDLASGDAALGLRVRLQEGNVAAVPTSDYFQLQWEKNASGTWNTVTTNLADSFEVAANPVTYPTSAATAGAYQSFIGNGQNLTQVQLQMRQTSGAGNMRAILYSHNGDLGAGTRGSLIQVSATRAKNSLGTSYGWESWDFDGSFLLVTGVPYFIGTSIIDGTGTIDHLGNTVGTHHGNAWLTSGGVQTSDLLFRVYTTTPTGVRSFESANLTGEAATTNRLTGGTGSFTPGEIDEDGIAESVGWPKANYTELLFSIQLIAADLAHGDTLRFRVLRNGAVLNTYAQTPTLTASKVSGPQTFQVSGTVAVTTDSVGTPWIPPIPQPELVFDHPAAQPVKAVDASLPMTLGRDVAAGDLLVMSLAFDNTGAGTPNVASIDKPGDETATWTIEEHQSPNVTAGTGIRNATAWMFTTVPWSAAFTPNVTFTEPINAKVAVVRQFRNVGPYLGKATGGVLTGSPQVIAPGSLVKEGGLLVGSYAIENWGTITTPANDRTAGAWSAQFAQSVVNDGVNPAATHARTSQQYKIPFIGGVDVLYNPSRTDESAAIVLAFDVPPRRPMVRFVRNHTPVESSTSSSVMDLGLVESVPAGNLLIAAVSYDNIMGFGSPGQPQVSSIAKPGDETAEWTMLPARTSGILSTTGAAVMSRIMYIRTTVPWSASFVPQIVLTNPTVGKSAMLVEFAGAAGTHTGFNDAWGPMSTFPAGVLPAAQVPVDGMLIGFMALDNTATPTPDSDTDGFTAWSTNYTVQGSGSKVAEQHKPIAVSHDATFNQVRNAADDGVMTLLSFAPAVHQVSGTVAVTTSVFGTPRSSGECNWTADWPANWNECVAIPPQQVSGTVAVNTAASGTVSRRQSVSGTVPVVVGATGTVSAQLRVAGTVPVVVGTAGTVRAILSTAGIVPVITTATGAATRVPVTFPVSGTVPVVTTVTGDATTQAGAQQYQVSGTVPVVTNATGAATRVPIVHQVSGTVAVVTTATGAVTQKLLVSGTIPVVTSASGSPTVIGGAQQYPVSGTVAVVTTAAGSVGSQSLAVSGTAAVVTSASGNATRVPVTFQVSGTVAVQTAVSGTVTAKLPVSGTVPVTVNAVGAITSQQSVSGTVAVVTNASGSAFPPGGTQGTVVVTTGVSGSVTSKQGVSGTPVAVTVGVSGTVSARKPTAGIVPVTVGVSGTVSQVQQVSGTVAVVTGATGDATRVGIVQQVSGTVAVTTTVTGNATSTQAPQVYQVSGTVAVTTTVTGIITKRSPVSGTVAVITTAVGTVSTRMQISGTVPVTTTAVGAISVRYRVSGTVVVLTTVTGFIFIPAPPPLPCDGLTMVPSGPFLPLGAYGPNLTLQMEVDRLPLAGTTEGYSVTKTAERLTLEGVC